MSYYYDKEGKKIDMMEWCKLFEDFNYKVVQQDKLPNGKFVSTVWLGLDHQFGNGPPLIFETMIFPKKGSVDEEYCERYSTLEEAIKGHRKALEIAQTETEKK